MISRRVITAPAQGVTVEVDITGRFVAVEDCSYPGGATADLISPDTTINGFYPAIKNATYVFATEFKKLIITGGGGEGTINLLISNDPCTRYFSPKTGDPVHPLASDNALFIIDADWSYSGLADGATIDTLFDVGGQGNNFSHTAGGKAIVKAGDSPGGATSINFPGEVTSYFAASQVIPQLATNQAMQVILVMKGGSVSNSPPNQSILMQGGNNSQSLRFVESPTAGYTCRLYTNTLQPNAGEAWSDGDWHACLTNFREDTPGIFMHWDEESLTRLSIGNVGFSYGAGNTALGDDAYTGSQGIGNSAHRLGFAAAFLYDSAGFSLEPLTYAADKYGITLGP